jgi:membrane-bound serine protease (ClpP class)
VFLTIAADVAAMAPGTNIGAATPINMQGPMDSTLARKATNDAAAFARTIARQRGRNAEWAEDAVRHAVAASETEAVDLHVVDFVCGSLGELLERSDGRTWRRGADTGRIETRGRATERIDPGFRMHVLALLADPNVAYMLMLVGFYGILFELQSPGAILPGVVGGIALILAFFALSTLPVNSAGVALIVLGIVFFIAEIKVTSHGVLAAGGILSMLLGSLLLFHGDTRLSYGVIAGATLVTAAFFLWIVGAGLRAQRRKVQTGIPGMIGTPGEVIERVAPTGRVRVGGVLWNARSATPLEIGTDVEIVAVEGLTVEVRPRRKEASS